MQTWERLLSKEESHLNVSWMEAAYVGRDGRCLHQCPICLGLLIQHTNERYAFLFGPRTTILPVTEHVKHIVTRIPDVKWIGMVTLPLN